MLTSCISDYHGLPTLFINGEPTASAAYVTYLPERGMYREMGETGIHLYSVCVFFGEQTINESSQIHPFSKGIFDCPDQPDFSVCDGDIRRILEADPRALIFPRVNVSLPKWWEDEHPEELNDRGVNGHRRRPCFGSALWRETVAEYLAIYISHNEAADFRDHIVGYQIAGGGTEEWFPYDLNGGIGLRARENYLPAGMDLAEEGNISPVYPAEDSLSLAYQALSDMTAEAITFLCGEAKRLTGGRLIIGSFYGYLFEVPYRRYCHASLQKLLACPDVDFLCSPLSYAGGRALGRDHGPMNPIHSIQLHGKLFFSEVDERTYLSRSLRECRENACEPGTYEGGVWEGPHDQEGLSGKYLSRQLLRADFARQLVSGVNYWWFDMWGRWYDTDMLADRKAEQAILRQEMEDPRRGIRAETAVLVDEKVISYIDSTEGERVLYDFRDPLSRAGVSWACYEAADFDKIAERHRAFVLLVPVMTPAMQRIMGVLEQEGIPYLTVTSPEDLTLPRFRDFFEEAGIHLWAAPGDTVLAGQHYVYLYTASAGRKVIHLPRTMRIQAVLFGEEPAAAEEAVSAEAQEKRTAWTGSEIVMDLPAYTLRLFRLDEI